MLFYVRFVLRNHCERNQSKHVLIITILLQLFKSFKINRPNDCFFKKKINYLHPYFFLYALNIKIEPFERY